MTTLIGTHLRVETKSKEEYEGVLKCFSPQFDIVLGLSHKVINILISHYEEIIMALYII